MGVGAFAGTVPLLSSFLHFEFLFVALAVGEGPSPVFLVFSMLVQTPVVLDFPHVASSVLVAVAVVHRVLEERLRGALLGAFAGSGSYAEKLE